MAVLPHGTPGTVVFINQMNGPATLSPTFDSSPSAGDFLVLFAQSGGASSGDLSITGGSGSWTALPLLVGAYENTTLWYSVAAGGDTPPQVTCTSTPWVFAQLRRYTGVAASSQSDVLGGYQHYGTWSIAASSFDAAAGDLICAIGGWGPPSSTKALNSVALTDSNGSGVSIFNQTYSGGTTTQPEWIIVDGAAGAVVGSGADTFTGDVSGYDGQGCFGIASFKAGGVNPVAAPAAGVGVSPVPGIGVYPPTG